MLMVYLKTNGKFKIKLKKERRTIRNAFFVQNSITQALHKTITNITFLSLLINTFFNYIPIYYVRVIN